MKKFIVISVVVLAAVLTSATVITHNAVVPAVETSNGKYQTEFTQFDDNTDNYTLSVFDGGFKIVDSDNNAVYGLRGTLSGYRILPTGGSITVSTSDGKYEISYNYLSGVATIASVDGAVEHTLTNFKTN